MGSDEIDAAVAEAHGAFGAFASSVWYYRAMRDRRENLYADGGPREQLDEARNNAERLMRDELAML